MRPAVATAGLGLLLVLAAAAFDAEPLYVPGLAFGLMSAGAVAWVVLGSRGLRLERRIGVRTVEEEQPVLVEVEVRSGALPLPTGAIDDPLLPSPAPLATGRRRTRLRISVRFERRGAKVLEAPRVLVADPFGLARRTVVAGTPEELLVLPRLEPVMAVDGAAGGDGQGLGARASRVGVAAEVELDGLRPYRPGAPAARIAWGAWARTGELFERRLQPDGDTRPLVVLDPRAGPGEEGQLALDAAVRAAASLTVHLARRGGCALLLPGDRQPTDVEPSLASWARLHVRLALLESGSAPAVAPLAGRRGTIVYVTALTLTRPPRALLHAGGTGRLLVTPGAGEGRIALFTVAGCTGSEVGAPVRAVSA